MTHPQTDILLDIRNLRTTFDLEAGPLHALNDVSLQLRRGEILGLVGESGSGKSMTGFSIMGLLEPPGRVSAGRIIFDGRDLTGLRPEEMRRLRGKRIAMIFQDPMMTLNPVLRIDVQMIEAIAAHENVPYREARARARDALGMVGIPSPEERLSAYPHQFSGGMRQRVAIATALLHRPDLIIADEPTTALDVTIQAQILAEVQKLSRDNGVAIVWITHDLSVVARLADRIAVMYAGRIIESGPVEDVILSARHPYTAGLMDSIPSRNSRGRHLRQIPGAPPNIMALPQGCSFGPRCSRRTDACLTVPETTAEGRRGYRCFHPLMHREAAP